MALSAVGCRVTAEDRFPEFIVGIDSCNAGQLAIVLIFFKAEHVQNTANIGSDMDLGCLGFPLQWLGFCVSLCDHGAGPSCLQVYR